MRKLGNEEVSVEIDILSPEERITTLRMQVERLEENHG